MKDVEKIDLFGVCPITTAQKVLSGKWTFLILYTLSKQTIRFNELQRILPDVTQTTLTKQLRMMEENGLVLRTVYSQIPPKVEYSLTDMGKEIMPLLEKLEAWGNLYIEYLSTKKHEGKTDKRG